MAFPLFLFSLNTFSIQPPTPSPLKKTSDFDYWHWWCLPDRRESSLGDPTEPVLVTWLCCSCSCGPPPPHLHPAPTVCGAACGGSGASRPSAPSSGIPQRPVITFSLPREIWPLSPRCRTSGRPDKSTVHRAAGRPRPTKATKPAGWPLLMVRDLYSYKFEKCGTRGDAPAASPPL